ncbi:anhydro-N-acetylmuramic acid kinase [Pseudolysinimonas sp.]|uniref:anhydro-N-acetylmuramic acid kinase n=1 Tax=Pseudolysinimonas sp. TaxID=2680009 RepID=UPI003F808259
MRVLGMISGTSHDGIDVAIVDFEVVGDELRARIEHTDSLPYEPHLRRRLLAALPPAAVGFDVVCELDTLIGQAFADAARAALDAHGGPVDAVCSHGQTVFHWVDGAHALGTLQIGEPSWIAEATGLPVLSHLRSADVAAGGHGAPLVPVLDVALLEGDRRAGRRAGALNLGGIANVTAVAADADPVAWDIGPANALIDAAVADATGGGSLFDRDGALAAAGRVISALLDVLLAEPYYRLAPPKSSGKELFHLAYVRDAVRRAGVTAPRLEDLVATLTELTAVTVADALREARLERVLVSGGGVRNPVLLDRIRALAAGVAIEPVDVAGVPSDEKEAVAFALIGWATLHGLPGNVPSCTGARGPRVLGRLSPAPGAPLPATEALPAWPRVAFAAGADA